MSGKNKKKQRRERFNEDQKNTQTWKNVEKAKEVVNNSKEKIIWSY